MQGKISKSHRFVINYKFVKDNRVKFLLLLILLMPATCTCFLAFIDIHFQNQLMLSRYLKVFRKKIFLIITTIALIIISSVTKGKTATVTSTLAGICLIYAGITYVVWIIKTPTTNEKDEAA